MDRVVDSLVALLSELSDGQETVKITAALHDLLIAIMHVDHTDVQELIARISQLKHTGNDDGSGDGGSVGGSYS